MRVLLRTAPVVAVLATLVGCGAARKDTAAADGYQVTGPNQVVLEVPGMV